MFYSEYPEKSIEDFEVYEILGRGGFARVYRAKSLKTDQEVAIKIIDKKMTHHHGMTSRVRKEVELHSRLKHPSILELYTFFEDTNYVYLVLEMCHNGELHRKIRESGPLSEDQARQYLKQIVDGLKYLHSYNILHRDLTLANLLLTRDMKVKIADFGLATQLEPGVEHFTMCGTPNYISPEVVNRSRQGLESDVWSVGCMLYTMLVGKAPFDTKEIKGTLNRVQSGQFHLPTNISNDAKSLIAGLLQSNIDKRLNLQQLSTHSFMQSKKMHELFKNNSITDSGIGSMDKSHSNVIDSHCRNSLRERNSQDRIDKSKTSSTSQIVSHGSMSNENCCPADSCRKSSVSLPPSVAPSTGLYRHNSTTSHSLNFSQSELRDSRCVSESPRTPAIQPPKSDPLSCFSKRATGLVALEPLNAVRLRPIRQETRSAVLNILDDETVVIEFLKRAETATVIEVMCIDRTGLNIVIYSPDGADGLSISGPSKVPVSRRVSDKATRYQVASLPAKYHKKYQLAKRFVDLVRSRTVKLTAHTQFGRAMMMENDPCPDFEMVFNDNVAMVTVNNCGGQSRTIQLQKIHYVGDTRIHHCHYNDGTSHAITDETEDCTNRSSPSLQKWLAYFGKCRDYCDKVISHMATMPGNEHVGMSSMYPMTLGRRHCCAPSSSELAISPFVEDVNTTEHRDRQLIDRDPVATGGDGNVAFIADVGWATQLSNGGPLHVQFHDGSRLVIEYDCSTIDRIQWFPAATVATGHGEYREFRRDDVLPDDVHAKIELLPRFVRQLRRRVSSQHRGQAGSASRLS